MTSTAAAPARSGLRSRVLTILDGSSSLDKTARLVHALLVALVLVSVGAVIMESVPELEDRFRTEFLIVESAAAAVFTVEYALRLWCAPDHTPYAGLPAWSARLRMAATPSAIIDLLSIVPIYLQYFVPTDFKVLLLLRLARFFKLARYSPGMQSLVMALKAERKALAAAAVILLGLVLVAASAMHLAEHDAQPDKFGTIPQAMWWAIVTLTTVGYGDVVPVTVWGRMIAGVTMLCGIMVLALPIGIMATAFAEEIHKREFVVTWGLIARVPLFASLNAAQIADVMRHLKAQTVEADTLVLRRGEPAHAMYFIAAGEVEVQLHDGGVRLGQGLFFGEMALLKKTPRSANVRAVRTTKLLVLEAGDFHRLVERNPEIGERIANVAHQRSEIAQVAPSDTVRAELAEETD